MPRFYARLTNTFQTGTGTAFFQSEPQNNPQASDALGPAIGELRADYTQGPAQDFFKQPAGTKRLWTMPWIVQSWVRVLVRDATAGALSGIELGSFNAAPPFPNPSPTQNVIQLRVNEDPANYRFELLVNDSTGAGVQTIVADGAGRVPEVNRTYHFLISYQPGGYVSGYIDGILVATVTAVLPEQLGLGRYGLGIFAVSAAAGVFESTTFAGLWEQSMFGI